MSDNEPTTEAAQPLPELEKILSGMRLGEFFAMDDATMERAVLLLLAQDRGYMGFSALEFLGELDRRATKRHEAG